MKKLFHRRYFLFFVFFTLYLILAIVLSNEKFTGDEGRYVKFALNLTNGYYSPPEKINLWSGPGYPIILMPFLEFKLDLLYAKILNSIFLLGALIYFYKSIILYTNGKTALISTGLLGLYYPFYIYLPSLLTEIFSIFLVCGFGYHLLRSYSTKRKTQIILASLFLGFLALTKVIYGYVILISIGVFLIMFILKISKVRTTLFIFVLSLIWCLPYLIYTYNLTGKIFYWSNSGSQSLYWMSSPYTDEYGDWHGISNLEKYPKLNANHEQFFNQISKFDNLKKDALLKEKAIKNIISKPQKYFTNWLANWGRMIMSYPYTYTPQKLSTYFYLPNFIIVFIVLIIIYPVIIMRKIIPTELLYLLIFTLMYLFLSSLVSAKPRQFFLSVPFLLFIITFVLSNSGIEIHILNKVFKFGSNNP